MAAQRSVRLGDDGVAPRRHAEPELEAMDTLEDFERRR
jgi:hypothetical protein